MEIEDFIEEVEEQGHVWVADEMRLYHENPDILDDGNMVPNFDQFKTDESLPGLYFYMGMVYGIGLERKHDL